MKYQLQSLFLWKIDETSAEEQTHNKDPSAQTHDTNINLIRFKIVKEMETHRNSDRDITEAMYIKSYNRCSAMMNKQSQFSSL